MPNIHKKMPLYYYGAENYETHDLGVYLVWCEPKDRKQKSVIIPILATCKHDIHKPDTNHVEIPDEENAYSFKTESYIKAVAKKLSAELDFAPDDPGEWKPDSYKFSTVRICLGPLNNLANDEGRDIVDSFTTGHISFNDMVASYFCNSGTIGVTLEAIKEASEEVESPIGDEKNILCAFVKQDSGVH